jgi:8-oxo-dGTP pyrophosphatase MutT (NUDIX family)
MDFATYLVSLKILVRKGDKYLFLTDVFSGKFDLPGGRINDDERNVPLADIINREVPEELGPDLKYKLGDLAFQFRVLTQTGAHIFISVYEADYLSGTVQLSSEHTNFEWIDKRDIILRENDFYNNEVYLAYKKYFDGVGK